MKSDQLTIEKYELLLANASPDELVQVHTEAFKKLTPEQRELVYERFLQRATTDDERPRNAEPHSLADTATLIEQKSPGTLRRLFDDPDAGPLWEEPKHSFYAAFAGYILATELAFTLMLSYDAEATLSGDNDPNSPDQLWNTFGGDIDGF